MKLTPDQIKMIREATIDEAAFQRIITLFESQSVSPSPLGGNTVFNLDEQQIQFISALMDAIPVPVYIKDTSLRFVIVNQRALTIMGFSDPQQVIGKTDFDIFDAERAQYYFDFEQDILRTDTPILNQEVHFLDQNNDPVWILISKAAIKDHSGNIMGIIGVNLDVTAQKLAEQSLEQEHNLLRTVVDHIQDKIYVKDRDGHFVMANAATLRAHRTTAENHQGTTDFDYMDPERAREMQDEEQAIMETGIPMINHELYTPKDSINELKDDMWFLVSKVPLVDQNGDVIGLVGINRNITSRKVAAQHAHELKLEQERSQILSNFMTHSSHEFRTPLSIIQTATYLLKNVESVDKIQHYVDQIKQQTQRMNKLIDNLQSMLRLDNQTHIETHPLSLESMFHTILIQADRQLTQKQLTVKLVEANPKATVVGDLAMLSTALSLVLDNAIQYTHQGGDITIRYDVDDNRVLIRIQDTGIGMSEATIKRIFERFFRADESHSTSGFGLGLSIVKRVVELHGGEIEVESQLGVGTTVTLILPIRRS